MNQRLPPSPARCVNIVANLAPAWARQDHTTSPSVSLLLVSQHNHVHRIPLHVRDDRDTPLVSERNDGSKSQFLIRRKTNIFASGSGSVDQLEPSRKNRTFAHVIFDATDLWQSDVQNARAIFASN
jgi:hypothetical protein